MPWTDDEFQKATRLLDEHGSRGDGTLSPDIENRLAQRVREHAIATEPNAPGPVTTLPETVVEGDPNASVLFDPQVNAGALANFANAATFGIGMPLVRAGLSAVGLPNASRAIEEAQAADTHPLLSSLGGGMLTGGALMKALGLAAKTGTAAVPFTLGQVARNAAMGAGMSGTAHVFGSTADYGADVAQGTEETPAQRADAVIEGLPVAGLVGGGLGLGGSVLGAMAAKLRTSGATGRAFARNEDYGGGTGVLAGLKKPPGIQERIYNAAGEDHPVDIATENVRGPATAAALGEDAAVQSKAEAFKAAYNGSQAGSEAHPLNEVLTGALDELRANKSLEGRDLVLANNHPLQAVVKQAAKIKLMDGDAADAFAKANPGAVKLSLKEAKRLGLAPRQKPSAAPTGPGGMPMPAPAPEAPPTIPDTPEAMRNVGASPGTMPTPPGELLTEPVPPVPGPLPPSEPAGATTPAPPGSMVSVQPPLLPTMPSPVPAKSPGMMIPPPPGVPNVEAAPKLKNPTVVLTPRKANAMTLERVTGLVDQAAKAGQKTTGNVPLWVERLQKDIRANRLRFASDKSTADAPAAQIEVSDGKGGKTLVQLPAGSYAAKMHQIGEQVSTVQERNTVLGLRGDNLDPESLLAQKSLGDTVRNLGSGQAGLRDVREALDYYGDRDPELAGAVNDLKATNTWEALQPSTQLRPGTTNNPTTIGSVWNAVKYRGDPIARALHDLGVAESLSGGAGHNEHRDTQERYDTLKAILARLKGLPSPQPGVNP